MKSCLFLQNFTFHKDLPRKVAWLNVVVTGGSWVNHWYGSMVLQVFCEALAVTIGKEAWIAIIIIPVVVFCWIRNLESLAPFSLVANLCILFCLAVIFYEEINSFLWVCECPCQSHFPGLFGSIGHYLAHLEHSKQYQDFLGSDNCDIGSTHCCGFQPTSLAICERKTISSYLIDHNNSAYSWL